MERQPVQEFVRLRAEIRLNYIEKMQQLMAAIRVPKILLYWSTRTPDYVSGTVHLGEFWGEFPHFVNQAVIDELRPLADEYVEVVTKEGLPQPLRHKETGEPYEVFPADRFPGVSRRDANSYYPSPEMHRRAADALWPAARRLAAAGESPGKPVSPSRRGKRNVLVHFHIFKNAGMSFDRLLLESFGDKFEAFDPEQADACIDERGVIDYVRTRPDVSAVACHQLRPPLAGDADIQLHPVVFLRDPIDRVRSIFAYETMPERRQTSSLTHTLKANELGFRGFIEWCLSHPGCGSPICNYQTRVCSMFQNGSVERDWRSWTDERSLRDALGFFSTLPCIGIVEQFEKSVDSIVENYRHLFPTLRNAVFHENRMQYDSALSVEQKHEIVRQELGDPLFHALAKYNALDLELYRYATERLNAR